MNIDELQGENNNVSLKVKVLSIDKRNITTSKGETTYFYGLVGDETGVLSYTAWEFPAPIKAGDVVEIKYARTKVYNGRLRLYLSSNSEVMLRPGETMNVPQTYKEVKLLNISTKNPFVAVTGKISNMKGREYSKEGKQFMIYNGFIEDDTSKVRISSFGRKLDDGKTYKINGARVSEFNRQLELNIGDRTEIEEVNEAMTFERYFKIAEIENPAGGITLLTFVITLGTKSGIIKRCSECNKPLSTGVCPDHPSSPTILDIFTYFTVDDGTGYIQAIAGKNAILPFLNIKEDEIPKYAGNIYSMLEDRLLGHAVKINADFLKNDDGLSLKVNSIKIIEKQDIIKDINISEEVI